MRLVARRVGTRTSEPILVTGVSSSPAMMTAPDSDFRTPGSTFAGVYIRGVVTQTANVSVVACVQS